MKVLSLVEYACRDTVAILRVMLKMALDGKLRGLIILYRTADGREETVYTGAYKVNTRQAASATMSASMELLRANGELPGS